MSLRTQIFLICCPLVLGACGGRAATPEEENRGSTDAEPLEDKETGGQGSGGSSTGDEETGDQGSGGTAIGGVGSGGQGSDGTSTGEPSTVDCVAFCKKIEACYCFPPLESAKTDPQYYEIYLAYSWTPACEKQKAECVPHCEEVSASQCGDVFVEYSGCIFELSQVCATDYYLEAAYTYCADETQRMSECTK